MIAPASFIGFLLVFLATGLLASLSSATLFRLFHERLKALGPWAERRAACYAILLPPIFALAVTLVLAGRSLGAPWFDLHDHCPLHAHHLHLCVYHGGTWAERAWAIAILAGVGTLLAFRFATRLARLASTARALRDLVPVGTPLLGFGASVLLVKSSTPFSFAAGPLHPWIVISSAAWELLADDERRAVIEHEIAHVEHGDLWRRIVLEFVSLFCAPLLTRRLLSAWDHATERICDRRAATRVGEPAAVANALVRLARVSRRMEPKLGMATFSAQDFVARVEALLRGEPEGREAARSLRAMMTVSILAIVAAFVVLADPLHHFAESILG